MKACQIKELCNRTDGFHGVSKKPKPELIKELLFKYSEANKALKYKWTNADLKTNPSS